MQYKRPHRLSGPADQFREPLDVGLDPELEIGAAYPWPVGFAVCLTAEFRIDRGVFDGRITELSPEAAFIVTHAVPRPGTDVMLMFDVPGEHPVRCTAEVRDVGERIDAEGRRWTGMAVQFRCLDRVSRTGIRRYMQAVKVAA